MRPSSRTHACRYETEDDRKALLPVLRDLSRQEYLKKREDAKLVGAGGAFGKGVL